MRGTFFYRWQFIRDISQTGKYVRFTITPIELQRIPVAAFRDDTHLKEFLATAQAYAKSGKANSI